MKDARLYKSEVIDHDAYPTQAAIQISWVDVPWANRYSVYRIEGQKKSLVSQTSEMTEAYDRRAVQAMPSYEVVAERIGDISFEDMSFLTVEDEERDAQDMAIRMQSKRGDWRGHDKIGCDLDRYIGKANTPETAADIQESVESGLTDDLRFESVEIRVVPTAVDRVSVYAFHEGAYAKEDVSL